MAKTEYKENNSRSFSEILSMYIQILRPSQWIKNIVVFIPLFFSGNLFFSDFFLRNLVAFFALCLLSSSVYIINDIVDIERDKAHPQKKLRPISSGTISPSAAILISSLLFVISLGLGFILLSSEYFMVMQLGYFIMMLMYSIWLKNIVIVDTIVISLGFIMRALAGAIILQITLSAMLVLTIIGVSLLMSFGKRRSEISIMTQNEVTKFRPVMGEYPLVVLDNIIAGLFAITFMSYTLFAYGFTTYTIDPSITQILPPLLRNSHLLMLSVPLAFYALARYMLIVYRSDIAEHPENLWLKDRGLFISIFVWGLAMYFLIYVH